MRIMLSLVVLALFVPVAAAGHQVPVGPLYIDQHTNAVWCESNDLAGLQREPVISGSTVWAADTRVTPPGNVAACL